MSKSTILHVRSGQVPDKATIEAVVKAYPSVFGHACQYDGELAHEVTSTMWTVDQIMELLEGTKDGNRMLFFADWKAGSFVDPDNIQPFVLSKDEGENPNLVVAFEGNFDDYIIKDDPNNGEFNLISEVLIDVIQKFYVEGDMDKSVENMKGDKFKKLVSNSIKTRGWFNFLPIKGDPWMFGTNADMLGLPWGTISNKAGLEALSPKTEVKVEKKGGLAFLNKKTASVPAVP